MRPTLGRIYTYVRDGLAWRVRELVGDQYVDLTIVKIAQRWRPFLKKPVFFGITGSAGKTTAKELLLAVLSYKRRGVGSPSSLNVLPEVAKTILRVRTTHDFCVAELSEDRPGVMDTKLALLQPSVGIVTVIGNDHWSAFHSRKGIAIEVGKLIAGLPATGTAVLNADDELVLAMKATCAAKVITYGMSPNAELRAEDIRSVWPDRLALTLVRGSERVKVQTHLCGTHWIPSVLGAIGGGLAMGMTLEECAAGIASVAPFEGRMQPVTMPDGVTFIRDDFKASLWTVDACFEFMRAARAKRKVIVIGELSDTGPRKEGKYEKTAILAQQIADITIFVGPWASSVLKARKHGREDALRMFSHVRDAAEYVNSITREGDLVLLKGTGKQDHLLRIILARTGSVACWRDDCGRDSFCNECPNRNKPSGLPLLIGNTPVLGTVAQVPPYSPHTIEPDEQVIVGLGNPESKYVGTPHNIGYEVVEKLADSLGFTWDKAPEAWIARGSMKGRSLCLIKMQIAMNLTGAGLKRLADSMSFSPEQCVLVHDDLDLPMVSVRARLNGGAGGHRGVASILEAFQTDAFRRIKVGVGKTGAKLNRVEYVLTAFDAESRAAVDQGVSTARTRLLEMVERPAVTKQR